MIILTSQASAGSVQEVQNRHSDERIAKPLAYGAGNVSACDSSSNSRSNSRSNSDSDEDVVKGLHIHGMVIELIQLLKDDFR